MRMRWRSWRCIGGSWVGEASALRALTITDSIQPTEAVRVSRNMRVLSVASLLGEAVKRTAEERSVSRLFD